MEDEKGVPMPTLATERTQAVTSPDQQDDEALWDGDERLGYRNVPYKEFVENIGFPCAIGTAIAAGAAFNILAAGSIVGDTSPEALAELRHKATLLGWSVGCYANATVIVVALQFHFCSPAFCNVITQNLNYTRERRRKNEHGNLIHCIITYGTVGASYFSLLLQLAGTVLILEALRPFAPVLLAEITMALISVAGTSAFIAYIRLERRTIREKKVVRAAS